jgi:hypothetical protein
VAFSFPPVFAYEFRHGRIAGGFGARRPPITKPPVVLPMAHETNSQKATHMFDIVRQRVNWAGRTLTLETGRVARQADGAVLATYGETTVLATVVSAKEPKPGIDFLPLTVNYQEKAFAAGRIPGGYFKREGRPDREGDARLPPDRPSDPPADGRWLSLRHPDHRHRAVARS